MPDYTSRGIQYPLPTDRIKDGNVVAKLADDIKAVANTASAAVGDLDGQVQANIADVLAKMGNSLQYKATPPSGDMATWYGLEWMGIYRFPGTASVKALVGAPPEAKPGQAILLPVGSTTSTLYWIEFGSEGRTFERTVSSVPSQRTGWIQRHRMKQVGTSLTLTGGSAPVVRTDFAGRLPINLGVDIRKWKIHLRNYNLRDGNSYAGVLEIALSIGEAETDAFGNYTGNWIDGTQALLTPQLFTLGNATATELITPTYEYFLDKSKAYLLSYRIQGSAGQLVVEAQGGGFALNNPINVHLVSTGSTISKTMPLMVWIEAEVPETTPVYGAIGDSLTVGVSSTYPVHDSWLAKLARSKGAIPVFWAASGDTLANFASPAAWKASQWKAMSPVDAVYFAMGSNDDFGAGATLEEMKTRFFACWTMLRGFVGTNMVLCSIFPRFNGASPEEAVRKQYNEWLETELPGGASYFVDIASAITNPDGSTVNQKWTAAPTDIHLSSAGYGRVSALLSGNGAAAESILKLDTDGAPYF